MRIHDPLNITFNVATLHCATRCFPFGWRVTDNHVEPNLVLMRAEFEDKHTLTVWTGASDCTIFADREINWAFRAWHDWHHVHCSAGFDRDSELRVAYSQADDLIKLYGRTIQTRDMVALLFAEIIGQFDYNAEAGFFPIDQMAFVKAVLPMYYRRANHYVNHGAR